MLAPNKKVEIDIALSKLFFGCNLPFSVVESQYFKDFLKTLNDEYVPPGAKRLKTTLLDSIYSKLRSNQASKLPRRGILMLDGWKNSSNNTKQVAVMVKPQFEKELFLKSFDFSSKSADHVALLEAVTEASTMSEKEFNIIPYAFCSDNAAAEVKTGKMSRLISYTCHSHTGNLYLKDIHNEELFSKVHEIMIQFRQSSLETQLKNLGGSSIYLANATRWKGERDEQECFLRNLPFMKTILKTASSSIIRKELALRVFDKKFELDVKTEVENLSPICDFIDFAQAKNCSLAESTHKWLELNAPRYHKSAKNIRDEMICKSPALIAYALHPKLKGELMNAEMKTRVELEIWSNGRCEDRLEEYHKFKNGTGLYGDKDALALDPETYWNLMCSSSKNLSDFALDYISLPSSTASLERVFSMWSFVHSKSRNRLSCEKSEKLLYCYHTLHT